MGEIVRKLIGVELGYSILATVAGIGAILIQESTFSLFSALSSAADAFG